MKFSDMLKAALATMIAFLPNLVAALAILMVGLLIAAVLGRVVERVLRAMALERRTRVRDLVGNDLLLRRAPRTARRATFWLLTLLTAGVAIDTLKLAWLSSGMARLVAYLPHLVAAAGIVTVGYLIGRYVYRRSARSGISLFWSNMARISVLVLAGFMAVQELGVATAIVTAAFALGLGALALASGIAFGLGNRELAARITQDWYDRHAPAYRMRGPESEREEPSPRFDRPH